MKSSVCMKCDGSADFSRMADGMVIASQCNLCPGNHIITEADDAVVTFYPNLVSGAILLPTEGVTFMEDPEVCGEQLTDEQYTDIFGD